MVRGLDPAEARKLGSLLDQDPEGLQAYNELSLAFRMLEGDPVELGSTQQARILDGVLAEVLPAAESRSRAGWRLFMPRLAPVLSLVVLGLISTLMLGVGGRGTSDPDFQARGGIATGPNEHEQDRLFMRPFCIRQGVVIKTPAPLSPHTPDASCLLSDDLQLMLTHRAGYPHLLVFGQLISSGRPDKLLWYYPVPPTGESGVAPARADYVPLGQAIHLEVNHKAGRVRLVAVFSRQPLSAEVLFGWISGLGPRDSAGALLRQLAGDRELEVLEKWVELKETPLK
jgi:hypothetical protein